MSNKHDISKDPIIHNLIRRPVLSGEASELLDLTPLVAYNQFKKQLPKKYRSADGKDKFLIWFRNFKFKHLKMAPRTKKTPIKSAVDDEPKIDYSKLSPTGAAILQSCESNRKSTHSAIKELRNMGQGREKEGEERAFAALAQSDEQTHSTLLQLVMARQQRKSLPP